MGFLFTLGQLSVLADDLLNLLLQCLDVLIVLLAGSLQITDVLLHLIFALLSHEGLAHAVGDRTLVESLIRLNRHLNLIAHAH